MSLKSILTSFLGGFGKLVMQALSLAVASGLKDDVIALAVKWVKVAAEQQFTNNAQRREFVVQMLMAKGVSEGVARIAVEFAVKIVNDELGKLPTADLGV